MGIEQQYKLVCDTPGCEATTAVWAHHSHEAFERSEGWVPQWWASGHSGFGGEPTGWVRVVCPECHERQVGGTHG